MKPNSKERISNSLSQQNQIEFRIKNYTELQIKENQVVQI